MIISKEYLASIGIDVGERIVQSNLYLLVRGTVEECQVLAAQLILNNIDHQYPFVTDQSLYISKYQ